MVFIIHVLDVHKTSIIVDQLVFSWRLDLELRGGIECSKINTSIFVVIKQAIVKTRAEGFVDTLASTLQARH